MEVRRTDLRILLLLVGIVFLVLIISALVPVDKEVVMLPLGNTLNGTTYAGLGEDKGFVYNISVNNTAEYDAAANITEVNVTIDAMGPYNASDCILDLATSNYSQNFSRLVRFSNMSNSSTLILSWANNSNAKGYLLNGSNSSVWLGFNMSCATPGIYNLSVILQHPNLTLGRNITSFVLTINDTTAPSMSLVSGYVTSRTNYSQLQTINITIVDNWYTGLGVGYVNLTIYNTTGANFTVQMKNLSGGNYNWTFNTTAYPDGKYNLTIYANDTSALGRGNFNNVNITNVIFDNTKPAASGFNLVATKNNYSESLLLNVSVNDTTSGIGRVIFGIINASGNIANGGVEGNGTYTATQYSNNYWAASVDTTAFGDGIYNITVAVMDTAGNYNLSYNVSAAAGSQPHTIIIDNTDSVVTFSCSPATVATGETVTCGCSGVDPFAGVNTTSYTIHPSTVNTGVFHPTCTVIDNAQNSITATAIYTVELSGGSIGGGGGGSTPTVEFYTTTIPQASQEFSVVSGGVGGSGITYNLAVKQQVKLKINDALHYVGVREVTTDKVTIEVRSDPIQVSLGVGQDVKVDVEKDGTYDVYVKVNSIVSGKANITMNYLNEAVPAGSSNIETPGEVVSGNEEPTPTEIPEAEKSSSSTWIIAIIIVIVVAAAIGGGVAWKKSKSNKRRYMYGF